MTTCPKSPCGGRRDPDALEADSPAFHKLCSASWAVQIGRSVITNKSIPFGAVVVYAAACAWRDRGQGFGYTDDEGDFIRNAASIPPGGWPALVGVMPHTWRRWRTAAVSANLIEIFSTGLDQLLSPMVEIEDREQWARVEVAVLFHRNLSQRARRVFAALSLFRQSNDFVSISIRKIGDDAGLERRAVQRALRELAAIGVLKPAAGRGYLVIKSAPPGDSSPPLPGNNDRPPLLIKSAPTGNNDRPPLVIMTAPHLVIMTAPHLVILTALSRVFFRNLYQELTSRTMSGRIRHAKRHARTLTPIAPLISPYSSRSIQNAAAASHGRGRSKRPTPGSREGRSSSPWSRAQGAMPSSATKRTRRELSSSCKQRRSWDPKSTTLNRGPRR